MSQSRQSAKLFLQSLELGPPPHPQASVPLPGQPWEGRGVGTCRTHVHETTNVPVLYIALGLNDFDAGTQLAKSQFQGPPILMAPVMDVAHIKIIM